MNKVYVAASSSDITRAEQWRARLRDAGFTVVSTWPHTIKAVGDANPRDATDEQRRQLAESDLTEVRSADALWFLVPQTANGRGAYCEFGSAGILGKLIVASGDTKQSIFLSLAYEFADDMDAFTFLVRRAKEALDNEQAEIRKALDSYQTRMAY